MDGLFGACACGTGGRAFDQDRDRIRHHLATQPEIGSIIVRGRAGGAGAAFNLGEMTVTRCALKLACDMVGHGHVQGRSKADAEAAARVDALMQTHALTGGFTDAPIEASFVFRALMNAMARPCNLEKLVGATPPEPLSTAASTALLTLSEPETPHYLAGKADTPAVRVWVSFHTGAPSVDRLNAMFALGTWSDLMPLDGDLIGTPKYPDRSTRLIVECDNLMQNGATLRGAGIKVSAHCALPDLQAIVRNNAQFPLGLGFYFTRGTQVAALPRSTRIG